MLEKLKNLFQRKKKDKTVESRSKKKGHKFLLLFFFPPAFGISGKQDITYDEKDERYAAYDRIW